MSDELVLDEVKKAVQLHHDSKCDLEKRLIKLLNSIEDFTVTIAGYKITYRDVYQYCSQWSNLRGSLHAEKAYVIDGKWTLGTPDASFWDGHNNHYADCSETYSSIRNEQGGEPEELLSEAPSSVLREIAKALPAFLADYAARLTLAATENSVVTAALPQPKE